MGEICESGRDRATTGTRIQEGPARIQVCPLAAAEEGLSQLEDQVEDP
jgi:hypothetical protein